MKQKKDQGKDLGWCLFHPYLEIDQDQDSVRHISKVIDQQFAKIRVPKSKPIVEITWMELQTIK